MKNALISFGDGAENILLSFLMHLQIASRYIYKVYNEAYFRVLESQANNALSHLTKATLQDNVMANFQFQRLRTYSLR